MTKNRLPLVLSLFSVLIFTLETKAAPPALRGPFGFFTFLVGIILVGQIAYGNIQKNVRTIFSAGPNPTQFVFLCLAGLMLFASTWVVLEIPTILPWSAYFRGTIWVNSLTVGTLGISWFLKNLDERSMSETAS